MAMVLSQMCSAVFTASSSCWVGWPIIRRVCYCSTDQARRTEAAKTHAAQTQSQPWSVAVIQIHPGLTYVGQHHACVVEHHIELAEFALRDSDHVLHIRSLCGVSDHEDGLASSSLDSTDGVGDCLRVDIDSHNGSAFLGKQQARLLPNAAAV